jgi:hypothetical protein
MERHGSGLVGGRNSRHKDMRDIGLLLRKKRSKMTFRRCEIGNRSEGLDTLRRS